MNLALVRDAARLLATPLYSLLYRADRMEVARNVRRYLVGIQRSIDGGSLSHWRSVARAVPGLEVISVTPEEIPAVPQFVYESADAAYLQQFRKLCQLDEIVQGADCEYDAMLRLGAWVGTRWDHGIDAVPGGNLVCDPVSVVAAGEKGAKFWCEIAARTTVHAATALQWNARMTTASRDGRTYEHAVSELWSNQFGKWFALDTDFNVVFEHEGIPLSAFELVHDGERLHQRGKLTIRGIAAPKPSLPYQDLLPFYRYVHVDMRNDWCSRNLAPGSPCGGDLATWWTARDSMRGLLTAKLRVDDPARFDWPLNWVAVVPLDVRPDDAGCLRVEAGLAGYSSTFDRFEIAVDSDAWSSASAAPCLRLTPGRHVIAARMRTLSGYPGSLCRVQLAWA